MDRFFIFFLAPVMCFSSLNFIHIPKTGGMSMRFLIKEQFQSGEVYPFTQFGEPWPVKDVNAILNKFPPIAHRAVCGHFPVWFLQKKDPDFFTTSFSFTILRDPIERVLSHYFFLKTLKDPIRSPVHVLPNFMCRVLCSDPSLAGESLLANAIYNLERLDFVIFLDDFDGGVRRLFAKLNFPYKEAIPSLNQTPRSKEFDQDTMNTLRRQNDLDIRLYDYAKTYLRNKSF